MNADSFPTFRAWGRFLRRCLRRIRLVFFSRKSLVVYLVVFSLGTLAWFADRWHGRRAWAREKERLAEAGETLDLKALLPGLPPAAENFCAIPELQALRQGGSAPESELSRDRIFMWYGKDTVEKRTKQGKVFRSKIHLPAADADSSLAEICSAFRKSNALPQQPLAANPAEELMQSAAEWEDLLTALDAAVSRPAAVLIPAPVERVDTWMHEGLHRVFRLARSLTLHGLASLETRNPTGAHRDLRILERLADAAQNEKSFISLLVAETIRRISNEVIRSGIRRHQWSEPELTQFMKTRSETALADAWFTAMQTERATTCKTLEHPGGHELAVMMAVDKNVPWTTTMSLWVQSLYWKYAPEGPGLRYCAATSQFYSRLASEIRTPAPDETWMTRMRKIDDQGYPSIFGRNVTEGTARLYGNPLFGRRLVRGACILEQYYLKNRRYPASLNEISGAPPETFTDVDGQPLHYRTNAGGTNFRLWSVGWDGNDDSANTDPKKKWEDWVFSTE